MPLPRSCSEAHNAPAVGNKAEGRTLAPEMAAYHTLASEMDVCLFLASDMAACCAFAAEMACHVIAPEMTASHEH